jgi:hypothetical protein
MPADETDVPEHLLTDEERKKRAKKLSKDIAEKYDPERLSKIVVSGAGSGERLDAGTRSEMESRLGTSLPDVRVFRGPFAETVTRQHKADAVTVGSTGMILVREGPRSDPKTALGKALLAHELTHVAQAQKGLHFALEGGESQHAPHEKEAEKVESAVHAEESGGGGKEGGGSGHHDPTAMERAIIERVLQLVDEDMRISLDRSGPL